MRYWFIRAETETGPVNFYVRGRLPGFMGLFLVVLDAARGRGLDLRTFDAERVTRAEAMGWVV